MCIEKGGVRNETPFFGDLYKPEYGVEVEPIDYIAGYTADGFRRNSSRPPFDIVVLGDSYIEIGERDDATFAELLKAETGTSVLNLGMAFYGPYQYVEVLKRHGLKEKPKYALFALFAGNDFEDIIQYEQWKRGGPYYFYGIHPHDSFLTRFSAASTEVLSAFGTLGSHLVRRAHGEMFEVEVSGRKVPIAFGYLEGPITQHQAQSLRSVLEEFGSICRAAGIVPLAMYIPSAIQMYSQLTAASQQAERTATSLEVVTTLTRAGEVLSQRRVLGSDLFQRGGDHAGCIDARARRANRRRVIDRQVRRHAKSPIPRCRAHAAGGRNGRCR